VHWHGVILPAGMDGVAGLTQKAIPVGQTFKYEFTMRKAGTFMYHPHFDEMVQIALGMVGMIVVHPKRPDGRRVRDYSLMAHEWMIPIGSRRPDPLAMSDFNVLTFNSKAFPSTEPLVAELGDLVRIRLGNLGPMDHHPIHLHGYKFEVVETDGGRIPKERRWPETTTLVPVGAVRVIEFIADNPGDWAFHCHMTHHVMPTEPAVPEQPAAPDPAKVKADLLAAEMTAYEDVKPLVEKYCAICHSKGNKGGKAKILAHFETTTYPFGGHHAIEVGKNVRKVLGIGGGKPTMPKNKPGTVKGDELALFAAWADAFDASHAGGAHEGHGGGGGGHDHSSMNHGAPDPAEAKPAAPAKVAAAARFDIAVTSAGFEPKNVTVPRGKPVVLRFERRVERTCGTEVVMTVDGQKIQKDLPLNKPVELAMTFGTAGVVKYACSMDMIRGTITVQ